MKRFAFVLMACALVMGLAQCSKENENDTTTDSQNTRRITLHVNNGGQKTGFTPATGTFVWSGTTEYINVGGDKSGYLGQLTGTGDGTSSSISFTGDIADFAADEETLYFFYLGNGDHKEATTLNFSNQNGDLDHVTNWHIAVGSATIESPTQTVFNVTLEMKSAIALIDMSDFSEETVYVHGDDVYATANIDYKAGTISGDTKGYINLGVVNPSNAEKFIALIPSTTEATSLDFYSETKIGSITFNSGIQAGKFYAKSDASALPLTASSKAFSVSASKQVFFSPGNLQYQASNNTWRFAEHQYDMGFAIASSGVVYEIDDEEVTAEKYFAYDGDDCSSLSIYVSSHYTSSSTAYIDMFGLGAWGSNPYNTSTTYSDYNWNNFNATIDGVDEWRILSKDEWDYLLRERTNASQKWSYAKVNNVRGIVLLPDLWTLPSDFTFNPGQGNPSDSEAQWNNNTYTEAQWVLMEANGAMFLPAAGYRSGYNILRAACYEGFGYYWTNTPNGTRNFYSFKIETGYDAVETTSFRKDRGCSVRLVRDAN